MKKLLFERLLLISQVEKAAKTVAFHPQVTVVEGENDTGKSSLIKSLYWVLGAEPAVMHPRWKTAAVTGLLEFSIDGEKFKVLRTTSRYGLFSETGKVLLKASSVTKELGPALAERLNFKLLLADAQSEAMIPPPAFCFLPFYIDQDRGWSQGWRSFSRLEQFPRHRQDVIYYHSGIRPNEYYELKARIADDRTVRADLESERKAVQGALDKIRAKHKFLTLDFDPEVYRAAVDELLSEVNGLQGKREIINNKLNSLSSQKTLLEEQSHIARAALSEIDKDYAFVRDQFSETILCPTCGTEHENSFANRFSLLEDRESTRAFLIDVSASVDDLSNRINAESIELGRVDEKVLRIRGILEEKRGALKLQDIIDSESEKKALEFMASEVDSITSRIANLDHIISELERDLNKITDKKKKEEIEQYHLEKITGYLRTLNVNSLSPVHVESIDANISDTGSDQPRALLAYFYSYIHTLLRYGSCALCPMVIDSPNQQDQDAGNIEAMFNFIFDERPAEAQLILGTVSLHGVPHVGSKITLQTEDHLLQASEYEVVSKELEPYLDQLY